MDEFNLGERKGKFFFLLQIFNKAVFYLRPDRSDFLSLLVTVFK